MVEHHQPSLTPSKLKVSDLREELVARGLSPKGVKKELVSRLEEALASSATPLQESLVSEDVAALGVDGGKSKVDDTSPRKGEASTPSKRGRSTKRKTSEEPEPVAAPAEVSDSAPTSTPTKELMSSKRSKADSGIEEKVDYSLSPSAKKPTPKNEAVQPAQPSRMPAELKSQENGSGRVLPPTTRTPTNTVHITNLVRPFTVSAIKELLAEFGQLSDFWMDSIKSHSYVTFANAEQATRCREGLFRAKWPSETGKALMVEFASAEEMRAAVEKEAARTAQVPAAAAAQPAAAASPAEDVTFSVGALLKSHQVRSIDELFKKTTAKPAIYYLPRQ